MALLKKLCISCAGKGGGEWLGHWLWGNLLLCPILTFFMADLWILNHMVALCPLTQFLGCPVCIFMWRLLKCPCVVSTGSLCNIMTKQKNTRYYFSKSCRFKNIESNYIQIKGLYEVLVVEICSCKMCL